MRRTADDQRQMPPRIHDIKPLFALNKEHSSFLTRPLTDAEQILAYEWTKFYRNILRSQPCHPHECIRDFFDAMQERGYGFRKAHVSPDHPRAPFQNLFIHAPRIHMVAALARIVGTTIVPTEAERRLAFRETVALHQREHDGALPIWADFERYKEQRLFLPQTGILALARTSLIYGHEGAPKKSIDHFYRIYFDVPQELSEKQVQALVRRDPSLDELVANYSLVQAWLEESFPNVDDVVASGADISRYAKQEGGIEWVHYHNWIYVKGKKAANTPRGVERSLQWIRSQCGVEGNGQRLSGMTKLPRNYWKDPNRIREGYIAAWKSCNPDGWNPPDCLSGPPSPEDLSAIGKVHMLIKLSCDGDLDADFCRRHDVPTVEVPAFSTIRTYPGGFITMLRDIEREFAPTSGIDFTDKRQLANLHRTFTSAENHYPVGDVPRAVARHVPRAQPRSNVLSP